MHENPKNECVLISSKMTQIQIAASLLSSGFRGPPGPKTRTGEKMQVRYSEIKPYSVKICRHF